MCFVSSCGVFCSGFALEGGGGGRSTQKQVYREREKVLAVFDQADHSLFFKLTNRKKGTVCLSLCSHMNIKYASINVGFLCLVLFVSWCGFCCCAAIVSTRCIAHAKRQELRKETAAGQDTDVCCGS